MYKIVTTNNFKNDVKRCKKRGYDIEKLEQVIDLLSQTGTLPPKYKPHKLTGNLLNTWNATSNQIGYLFGSKMI